MEKIIDLGQMIKLLDYNIAALKEIFTLNRMFNITPNKDILNDIGDSYEDLLTVSATTREPYFTATQELINSAETIIADNSNLEIVYPSKILDFRH